MGCRGQEPLTGLLYGIPSGKQKTQQIHIMSSIWHLSRLYGFPLNSGFLQGTVPPFSVVGAEFDNVHMRG